MTDKFFKRYTNYSYSKEYGAYSMGKSRSPRTQILIKTSRLPYKTSRRDPPHKVLGGISEMRPDGGPNSRSTNGNRQTEDHARV